MMFPSLVALGLSAALASGAPAPGVAAGGETAAQPASAPAPTAVGHTRALIEAYRACGDVPASKPCAPLDDLFDFATLSHTPLKGHESKLTPSQRRRFYAAFDQVVRQAARSSGKELTRGAPELQEVDGTPSSRKVDVHVVRPEDDVDTHVAFVWRKAAQRWQIVDVEIDGASMVQDYHNQFGRVLKKDGAATLVDKIEARANGKAKAQ